eukprot:CAMPEP_0184480062 /NCGR_PEP_ID=MMETSP0113_2-20130426/1559_1 /TAXON_ID=91329 /ORGANISM="Norrisiella sphaerica, Strain BC52" /LENGTH=53 /DNA_ID=CAMNT_0026858297 /DNA_START=265 /DNA_END=426 /DNA_ORIENTATION=-
MGLGIYIHHYGYAFQTIRDDADGEECHNFNGLGLLAHVSTAYRRGFPAYEANP